LEICRENLSVIKIRREYQVLYIKTNMHLTTQTAIDSIFEDKYFIY